MRRGRPHRGLLASLVVLTAWAAPAHAAVTVTLRVEGATQTLYDGPVNTGPQQLDGGDGSGAHPCMGTSSEQLSATPGDALASAGIDWQGNWFPEFRDFFVNRIGPDASQPPFAYWRCWWTGATSLGPAGRLCAKARKSSGRTTLSSAR